MDFATWKETKAKPLATWAAGPASQSIVGTFARFKTRAEVRRVDIGPATVHFTIAYGVSQSVGAVLSRESDLALALGVDPDQASMAQTRRGVVLSIPSPEPYDVTRAGLEDGRGLVIPLGVTADGWETYHLPFSETVTNLLIVAPTRTGKTTLLRTLVYGLAAQNSEKRLALALIDLKGDDMLADFGNLAHLRYPIATNAADAMAVLQDLAGEVERRIANGARRPAHVFVVIDEVIALVQNRQYGQLATEALTPILTRGGGLGIYTVATTQRADKRSLSDPLIASQFVHRLVGKVASGQESALAAGQAGIDAHKLLGRGDFIAKVGGEVVRVQIAQTPAALIHKLPTWTIEPTMPDRPDPVTVRGPGRPAKPIDPADVEFVRDHADEVKSLGAVQRLLGGEGRPYARRVALAAGLSF